MSLQILVPTPETPARRLAASEAPGRPARRVPGGWVADHTALGKAITLCPWHVHKFDPRHSHYELWRREMFVRAICSDCNVFDLHCTMFTPQALHDEVGEWSRPRPTRTRRWGQTVTRWLNVSAPWAGR